MAWDGVPWFVGGGAEHSPEVARLLSYAAFGGTEGIVGSADLAVREQAVPDGTVQVLPGACSILNRASAQSYQAYAARLPSAESVAISPTDASGPRSDLIVARVEDPYLSGEPWASPSDPKVGPYVFTRVIPNVPAGTTSLQEVEPGQSGIALARVDVPISTGTITQAMIQDLRVLPNPRREDRLYVHNQSGAGADLTSTGFVTWPSGASFQVDVPDWAVRVQIVGSVGGYAIAGTGDVGNVVGRLRARLGSIATADTTYNHTMPAGVGRWDAASTTVGDDLLIPASMRGTTQTLALEGKRVSGTTGFHLTVNDGQVTAFQVVFYEAPDA
jgi:hypothetical protein